VAFSLIIRNKIITKQNFYETKSLRNKIILFFRLMIACKNGRLEDGLQVLGEMEDYVRDKRRMKRAVEKLSHAVVGGRSEKHLISRCSREVQVESCGGWGEE
jgi:hypothetical protein